MQGFKEIMLSFSLTFATLLIVMGIRTSWKSERPLPQTEAIASQGSKGEDPTLMEDWGLDEIQARSARMQTVTSSEVIVAVIDTGCDIHHPDLAGHIWRNPGEAGLDENGHPKASNGIDDDNNGFVDDLHGWDFISNTPNVLDEHGHGTHVSGIVRRVSDPIRLMILKYYDTESKGLSNLQHTLQAFRYAIRMGAKVINYSGGGALRSQDEEAILRWAAMQGVVLVAAAGNEGLNSDFHHFYPANYDLPNILSVAAIDRGQHLLRMSNFGRSSVDLAAPGKNILSTLPNGLHGFMSGTSQATAFVSGAVAALWAQHPQLDYEELIQLLLDSTNPKPELAGKIRSGGIVNLEKALSHLESELASAATQRRPAQAN